jgi:glycosyltransferase involved in cell wall biosynthesis
VYDAVYPWVKGGAERRYYEIATVLAARGHDVHWYGMKYWDGPATVRIDGIMFHGVCAARPLYTSSGRRSISQAIIFGFACLRMVLSGGLSGCQVVDCCGFPFFSLFSVWLVLRVRRHQMVVTCHEVWGERYWREYLGRAGRVGALVERAALRLPQRIISVSEETSRRLVAELNVPAQVTVVPNGVDIAAIERAEEFSVPIDVLYVGRLVDFKNVDLLLEAVRILAGDLPSIRCAVVGDGPERARLETLAADLGLASNVHFVGFLQDINVVYGMMKSASVLVLPSKREGFGIVVLEANAAGLPVVVVDYPDSSAKELIGEANGVVVPPDSAALAVAAGRFMASGPMAFRESCHRAARKHDWTAVTAQWEAAVA